jgi:hypothetical protein
VTISFNHTIIAAKNKQESATFFTTLFGLPDAVPAGHFLAVALDNGVSLDFANRRSTSRRSTMRSSSAKTTSTGSTA